MTVSKYGGLWQGLQDIERRNLNRSVDARAQDIHDAKMSALNKTLAAEEGLAGYIKQYAGDPEQIVGAAQQSGNYELIQQTGSMLEALQAMSKGGLDAANAKRDLGLFTDSAKLVKELQANGQADKATLKQIRESLPESIQNLVGPAFSLNKQDQVVVYKPGTKEPLATYDFVGGDWQKTTVPSKGDTWGQPYEVELDGKKALVQKSDKTGQVRQVSAGPSSSTGNLDEGERGTLADMLGRGEMAPSQLGKRGDFKQVLALTKEKYPFFNPRFQDASFALAKNPSFRQKALAAQSLPVVLEEMVEAGKAVDFSNIKLVGRAQKVLLQEMNDPDFTKYMTLRNDSMQTIAAIMRMVGMSDKAVELEEEAAAPTMSPRALEAWLDAQMTALAPRLEIYTQIITNRKKPLPEGATTGHYKNEPSYFYNGKVYSLQTDQILWEGNK